MIGYISTKLLNKLQLEAQVGILDISTSLLMHCRRKRLSLEASTRPTFDELIKLV